MEQVSFKKLELLLRYSRAVHPQVLITLHVDYPELIHRFASFHSQLSYDWLLMLL